MAVSAAAAEERTTRSVTPNGATVSYPGPQSGATRGDIRVPPGTPGPSVNAIAVPPASAELRAAPIGPNATTNAQSSAPVQAFSSGAPNAAVDSAPSPAQPTASCYFGMGYRVC